MPAPLLPVCKYKRGVPVQLTKFEAFARNPDVADVMLKRSKFHAARTTTFEDADEVGVCVGDAVSVAGALGDGKGVVEELGVGVGEVVAEGDAEGSAPKEYVDVGEALNVGVAVGPIIGIPKIATLSTRKVLALPAAQEMRQQKFAALEASSGRNPVPHARAQFVEIGRSVTGIVKFTPSVVHSRRAQFGDPTVIEPLRTSVTHEMPEKPVVGTHA